MRAGRGSHRPVRGAPHSLGAPAAPSRRRAASAQLSTSAARAPQGCRITPAAPRPPADSGPARRQELRGAAVTVVADQFGRATTSDGSGGLWEPYKLGDTPPELVNRWGAETYEHLQARARPRPWPALAAPPCRRAGCAPRGRSLVSRRAPCDPGDHQG